MRSRVFLLVLPLLLAIGGPAFARGSGTLDTILPEIRAQHPGRMSDAEPFTASDGSTHYRIKWMTPEGRILYFDAEPHSGRYYNSINNDVGRQWRRGGAGDDEPRWNSGNDSQGGGDEDGGRRNWNGGGRDWPRDGGNGDWHGRPEGGNGDGRGAHGGNWGGRGGDWRGGHNGGDNGGSHHHHGG